MAPNTLISEQHTKITLGLVISVVLTVAAGAWWSGKAANRIESLEKQVHSQWQKLDKIAVNSNRLTAIDARLTTILELLRQ